MVATRENPAPKLELELRRGALVLAVLGQLREAQYGYSLRQALAQRGMPIEEGTLYPCCGGWTAKACSRPNGGSRKARRAATTA